MNRFKVTPLADDIKKEGRTEVCVRFIPEGVGKGEEKPPIGILIPKGKEARLISMGGTGGNQGNVMNAVVVVVKWQQRKAPWRLFNEGPECIMRSLVAHVKGPEEGGVLGGLTRERNFMVGGAFL